MTTTRIVRTRSLHATSNAVFAEVETSDGFPVKVRLDGQEVVAAVPLCAGVCDEGQEQLANDLLGESLPTTA